MVILSLLLVGCRSAQRVSGATVSVLRVDVVGGRIDADVPPPWTIVVVHGLPRRLNMLLEDGNFSDCGDVNQGCGGPPRPGAMPMESFGYASLPEATLATMSPGAVHEAELASFSARNPDTAYDTFSVRREADGQQPTFRWTLLARCGGDVMRIEERKSDSNTSGVITLPTWRRIRWVELRADCLPR